MLVLLLPTLVTFLYLWVNAGLLRVPQVAKREAKLLMTFYNILVMVLNWMVIYLLEQDYFQRKASLFVLQPVPDDGNAFKTGIQIFYVTKYLELLDTFFMHYKGNRHQVTNLHLFHHSSIIFVVLWTLCFTYETDYLAIYMNAFIHIFMYFYYLLALWKWPVQRVKPWLTRVQMLQFCITIVHGSYGIYKYGFAATTAILHVIYQSILLVGFVRFYTNAYKKTRE